MANFKVHHKNRPTTQFTGGWTLIELLTVVAIISILFVAIGMIVGVQVNRARDAAKIAELKDIQVYLERYYIDSSDATYPATSDVLSLSNQLTTQYPEYQGLASSPYLQRYTYSPGSGNRTYCICAEFESKGEKSNSDASCDFTLPEAETTHYCLVNKQ